MLPPLFSPQERAQLITHERVSMMTLAQAQRAPESPGEAAFEAAQARAVRERVQAESLKRLTESLPLAPSFLPLLLCDAAAPEAILELSRRVA
jgi:hypothetical protein